MSNFTITASPGTDIWRVPPSTNIFNVPTHPLIDSPVPLRTFQRARLTVSANWTTQYDHGGLLLHLTNPSKPDTDYWVKTGLEFYNGAPELSTAGTQTWSDWSIYPIDFGSQAATVEVRREETGLWVYQILEVQGVEARKTLRELTWFFAEEEGWNVDIKAMAARPAKEGDAVGSKDLVVAFEGVEVDLE
ncbi:hypothetical protein L218DRAFT_989329 [Marasmius fiardii PR-910]|nr:hypothetical protein L218DRAFT_989329 [Marasmius fiardii PR-910]